MTVSEVAAVPEPASLGLLGLGGLALLGRRRETLSLNLEPTQEGLTSLRAVSHPEIRPGFCARRMWKNSDGELFHLVERRQVVALILFTGIVPGLGNKGYLIDIQHGQRIARPMLSCSSLLPSLEVSVRMPLADFQTPTAQLVSLSVR